MLIHILRLLHGVRYMSLPSAIHLVILRARTSRRATYIGFTYQSFKEPCLIDLSHTIEIVGAKLRNCFVTNWRSIYCITNLTET